MVSLEEISGSIGAPAGFQAGAAAAGLKESGNLDVALIVADRPATVAGVFTTNQVVAAPVVVAKERVRTGEARGVVVNAGNANACTGEQGLADAYRMAAVAGEALGVPGD